MDKNSKCSSSKTFGSSSKKSVSIWGTSQYSGSCKYPKRSERVSIRKIVEADPIYEKPFFYGYMPREDIEMMLLHNGEFAVRKSAYKVDRRASGFCVSVLWDKKFNHVVVRYYRNHEGVQFCFDGSRKFKTVYELVQYYVNTGKPILSNTEGNYGEVWEYRLARFRDDIPEKVAVKFLKGGKVPKEERVAFFGECRRLRQLSHENLVTFVGIAVDINPVKMVMELCDTTLPKYLVDNMNSLTWTRKAELCLQAAKGMEYLSSQNIIHRDLAARNCLLKAEVLKLADLGMSRNGKLYRMERKKPIPIKWTPPEAIRYLEFSEQSDVWSFGVLVWEILTGGEVPYSNLESVKAENFCPLLLNFLNEGNRLEAPKEAPPELKKIMLSCMHIVPTLRPNFILIRVMLQNAVLVLKSQDEQVSVSALSHAQ
uniref:Tyrosine-protein kinase n=1 Tax=Trichuris muris TaxID=70415 RepID=A0A5S6QQZ4_TRIMR